MLYSFKLFNEGTGKVYVPLRFFLTMTGFDSNIVTLRAGRRYKEVSVIPMKDSDGSEFAATADVLEALSIPLGLSYQVRAEKNEIIIGPVIGLLLAKKRTAFTEKKLARLFRYALKYEEIHGLLYVFSIDGIDFDKAFAEGYCYVPGASFASPRWEKGVFPLPDAVYRRVSLAKSKLAALKQLTGNRLFNSCYFNKWEFWLMASKDESVKNNIPFTCKYKSFDDLDKMLDRFGSVYLKPINGTLGNGLVKAARSGEGWTFQRKYDKFPANFAAREQAAAFADAVVGKRRYLVQQDIRLLKYNEQYVDFRVNMQKDFSMEWNCTGMITCTGASGGIHSNYTNAGQYLSFENFMLKGLSAGEEEILRKKREIIGLCRKICKMLDESGENYGDLGIDIGFDAALKPWIFEVNKTQFQYLPLMVNDYQTYYTARANPLRYAAALCGFKAL
jgi:hypothetical protein